MLPKVKPAECSSFGPSLHVVYFFGKSQGETDLRGG
jgi:hypothetical protein